MTQNLTWDKAVIISNLKDELQRHPELRELNSKLNKQVYSARAKLKALAEKHNVREFINKSDKVRRQFKDFTDTIPTFTDFSYSTLKKKAENLVIELNNYSEECWFYCQGDTRKVI